MSIRSLLGRLKGRKIGRVCALDFDGRHLRLVLADVSGRRARIDRLETVEMPADLRADDAGAVGAFLGETLRRMRLGGVPVLMNVPRAKAVFKPLTLPAVEDEGELASMVRFQAQKELTFRPEEAVIDFALEAHYGVEPPPETREAEAGEHVLVAAVQNDVVQYYRHLADAAGATLLRLGLRPYANMRSVEAYAGGHEGRLGVVHLTAHEAEVDVIEQGGLTFSRSADIVLPQDGADSAAGGQMTAALIQEVVRSLQSYLAVERERRIDRVVVAGGSGVEPEVAEALAARLGLACEVFDPSAALNLKGEVPGTSAYISALGLAVGQGDADAPPFDFLNPKRPPVRRDLTRTVGLGAAAAVLLVVVSAFAGAAIHLYRAGAELEARKQELQALQKENKRVKALAKRVGAIEGWVEESRNWLDQWAYLSATFPSCRDVYLTSLDTGAEGIIGLKVKVRSSDAIDELGRRLARAGYGFKPGQVTSTGDKYGYDYATSVKVIVEPDMEVNLAEVQGVGRPGDDVSAVQMGGRPAGKMASRRPGTGPERPDRASSAEQGGKTDGRDEPEKPSAGKPDAGRMDYDDWRQQVQALSKQRPDKQEDPKAYAAWRTRMRELYQKRPRRPNRGRNDTRYPNARF